MGILLGGAGDQSLRSGALLEAPLRKSPTGRITVKGIPPTYWIGGERQSHKPDLESKWDRLGSIDSVGHFGSRLSGLASDPTTTQPGSQSALANMSDGELDDFSTDDWNAGCPTSSVDNRP